MATYATLSELNDLLSVNEGSRRIPDSVADDDTFKTSKLRAASAMIDAALLAGGYPAPLDVGAIDENAAALLAHKCAVLAWGLLKPSQALEKTTMAQAFADCMEWLDRIATGAERLAGVAKTDELEFGMACETRPYGLPLSSFNWTIP